VVSDDGPIMSTWVCRAALQRSVSKICYHAGFEELQPSALDVITDIAGDFFGKIARTLNVYREAPKVQAIGAAAEAGAKWQDRFTHEELILHTLSENGLDVESLESYVSGDMDRFGLKLGVMHERMKSHLADILRPALSADAGADGVGAFNDGSDQFVTGDFADDIGEDFFGLRELGLSVDYVPLHLLRSKIHTAHQVGQPGLNSSSSANIEELPPFEPVTRELVETKVIGIARDFFLQKLEQSGNDVLVEDLDLPLKQQFPKPRLPPTGKITSPRKRPLREQIGNAKKKKKMEGSAANGMENGKEKEEKGNALTASAKKLKLALPGSMGDRESSQGEKEDGSAGGLMSPESIER
jgi:transcriptional activator SPT7